MNDSNDDVIDDLVLLDDEPVSNDDMANGMALLVILLKIVKWVYIIAGIIFLIFIFIAFSN